MNELDGAVRARRLCNITERGIGKRGAAARRKDALGEPSVEVPLVSHRFADALNAGGATVQAIDVTLLPPIEPDFPEDLTEGAVFVAVHLATLIHDPLEAIRLRSPSKRVIFPEGSVISSSR